MRSGQMISPRLAPTVPGMKRPASGMGMINRSPITANTTGSPMMKRPRMIVPGPRPNLSSGANYGILGTIETWNRVCRLCARTQVPIFPIKNDLAVIEKIKMALNLEINIKHDEENGYPPVLCRKCASTLTLITNFKKAIREGQDHLEELAFIKRGQIKDGCMRTKTTIITDATSESILPDLDLDMDLEDNPPIIPKINLQSDGVDITAAEDMDIHQNKFQAEDIDIKSVIEKEETNTNEPTNEEKKLKSQLKGKYEEKIKVKEIHKDKDKENLEDANANKKEESVEKENTIDSNSHEVSVEYDPLNFIHVGDIGEFEDNLTNHSVDDGPDEDRENEITLGERNSIEDAESVPNDEEPSMLTPDVVESSLKEYDVENYEFDTDNAEIQNAIQESLMDQGGGGKYNEKNYDNESTIDELEESEKEEENVRYNEGAEDKQKKHGLVNQEVEEISQEITFRKDKEDNIDNEEELDKYKKKSNEKNDDAHSMDEDGLVDYEHAAISDEMGEDEELK